MNQSFFKLAYLSLLFVVLSSKIDGNQRCISLLNIVLFMALSGKNQFSARQPVLERPRQRWQLQLKYH
jgi:hypothetical protein